MKSTPRTSQLVTLSERVFRALLILYPVDFRQAYGQHMTQVFRDVCRDAYQQAGTLGLANWWSAALLDLLQSVVSERRKVSFTMSQDKFIQWSGWLCILGGVFFALSSVSQLQSGSGNDLGGVYQLSVYALVPGMTLITLALLGMFLRFNPQINLFGRLALLTAIVGAGAASIGWLFTLTNVGSFWNVFMMGWLVHLAGFSVFGGFATTTHLLPRWNFALLIGSAFPLTVVLISFSGLQSSSGASWGAFVMLLLIGTGWLMTGWALNSQPVALRATIR